MHPSGSGSFAFSLSAFLSPWGVREKVDVPGGGEMPQGDRASGTGGDQRQVTFARPAGPAPRRVRPRRQAVLRNLRKHCRRQWEGLAITAAVRHVSWEARRGQARENRRAEGRGRVLPVFVALCCRSAARAWPLQASR